MLWLVIAVRVLANPGSNALQKVLAGRGISPLWVIAAVHAGLSLLVLPWLLMQPLPAGGAFWGNLAASAALATAANTLIVVAVHRADLSLVGPVNSYKPVVSLLPGWLLLAEMPTWAGIAGIGLVVVGSSLLNRPSGRRRLELPFRDRGVQIRIAALIPSAFEAVFLKRALAVAGPATVFAWWSVLCLGAVAAALIVSRDLRRTRTTLEHLKCSWRPALALVTTSGLMQGATVVTLKVMQVGYALALFQLSSIITVLLGRAVFGETDFRRRLTAALVMALGAAIIVAGG